MLKNNLDFNHIDKIIKNGLTNRKYYRVLGIIGQSEQPPDNNQIKENFKKIYGSRSWDKYYYEILRQLSPNSNDVSEELLFTWEELMILEYNQLRQKCHNILQKIHHLFDFKIDNHLKENYLILMDGNSLKESNKWIIIQKNDITLKNFNPYVDEDIFIMIYDNSYDKSKCRFFPILTNKKKGKIHVYSKSYTNSGRRQFLNLIKEKPINFVYSPGQKNENEEKINLSKQHHLLKEIYDMKVPSMSIDEYLQEWFLKQYGESQKVNLHNNKKFLDEQDNMKILYEKINELNRITNDREYFRYSLNLKGLILLLILYDSIKKTKHDEILFNKVLSNLSTVRIAPFLKYLNEFEKLGFKGKELIVTIAEELRNQLHLDGSDGFFLLERVIERFYKDFRKYNLFTDNSLYNSLIDDYNQNMISILKDYIKIKEPIFGLV